MGTEQQWDAKFLDSLVTNEFVEDASWNGCQFETYGEEVEHVRSVAKRNPNKVWTLMEGDDANYIVAGYYHVDAYGYLITEKEWEAGVDEDEYELDKMND